ncbi:uncharacterized protein CBL_11817 [Carabus blaptoides fortunei]
MAKNILVQSVFLLFILPHILAENYDFLQRCDKNDPNIDDCMLRSANLALPHLLKGNPKLGLPSFLPWKFLKYVYGSNDTVSITVEKGIIHGLEETNITNIKWNMDQRHINVQMFMPKIYGISDYIADGYFMDHKFSGKGVMFQILDEFQAQLDVDYEVNENGYATVTNVGYDMNFEKLTIYLQGLYNGEETNSLINQNLRTFYEIFEPVKRKAGAHVMGQIFKSVFQTNTIDSLFISKPLNGIKKEL